MMGYRSVDQLEQFEFHDSDWKLNSREGDAVTFTVENLNIHKDTEQNDEDWDMELSPARMTFRGFRLVCFEPGRSWTTDETGRSFPVGPRVLYTGEEGMELLAKECHVEKEEILDFDLYVYAVEKGGYVGVNEELISSPRLDNLTSCYALLHGISQDKVRADGINVAILFDHEEIGSRSKQGADSALLQMILEKRLNLVRRQRQVSS